MQKRGQFYLIAALVIIGIVAGLAAIYNAARTPAEDPTVYDLSKEIDFEGSQILDSGEFNNLPEEQVRNRLLNLTDFYFRSNPQSDFLILYGNETDLTFFRYNNTDSGTVGVFVGSSQVGFPQSSSGFSEQTVPRISEQITLELTSEVSYTIDLKPGQFFFVILKKDRDGERFVALPSPEIE